MNQPGSKSRAVVFSAAILYQSLQGSDFKRLFTNAVAWAGTQNPAPAVIPPNSVYVFRTGDLAADTEVIKALQERGYLANLGIRGF